MRYIEAFSTLYENEYTYDSHYSLFLAGGITNCAHWQDKVVNLLKNTSLTLINPRREHFDINDKDAARQQIEWEHRHLNLASSILFWFPCETLCPITLFEYGKWYRYKKVFVGCHPDYKRRLDIEIQTGLDSSLKIHNSLESLTNEVIHFWERL